MGGGEVSPCLQTTDFPSDSIAGTELVMNWLKRILVYAKGPDGFQIIYKLCELQ